MFLGPGPNALSMLFSLLHFVPPAIVVAYGIVLCGRHTGSRPKTARLVGIAIALLIAGSLPYYLLMLMSRFGWRIPAGFMSISFLIAMSQPLCQAAGLVLLFRAAFLDEANVEYIPGPPVYRNDDGPATEG